MELGKKRWLDKVFVVGTLVVVAFFVVSVVSMGSFGMGRFVSHMDDMEDMNLEEHVLAFTGHKEIIQDTNREVGNYACCLEGPCTYCIEKTPGHGEASACRCLDDIMNGVHPCGECTGEILEGHGNPLIAEYFATAIAETIGEQHIDTLRQIIEEKYGVPVEEQV